METVWDLRETVKHEKAAEKSLADSARQWQEIIDTFSADTSNVTNNGFEWKVRYECQHLYNQMLQKNIQRMRAELRMMRCGVECSPLKDAETETIGELRTRIRQLKIEKCSIKSLRDMYERQIDMESMAYHRTCAELDQLNKDVCNSQASRIRELEKADNDIIASLQTSKRGKRWKLKPIAKVVPTRIDNKPPMPAQGRSRRTDPSYTNMFLAHRGLVGVGHDESQRQHHGVLPETSATHSVLPETSVVHSVLPETSVVHSVLPDISVVHSVLPETSEVHSVLPETSEVHSVLPETSEIDGVSPETRVVEETEEDYSY